MAVTSVILDIRANTNRALADFKRFSSQLDNKFLVSGLKLDVVRSALGQINREFQKAIGEQGLQAGQSLRAAQNQAALLGQTFRDFSSEASMDITRQFSEAFSSIAVSAGGTAEDIKNALGAVSFISGDLPKELRDKLAEGVLAFQRDFRRAGLSGDISQVIAQFLSGQVTAEDLINSGDAARTAIGKQLAITTRTQGPIATAKERSEAILQLVSDPAFSRNLSEMAKNASGFRTIIEDLNARLFNPEKGVFGVLRQVSMSVSEKTTTVFDETIKLIESVFGKQGLFVSFFQQIGKIFGIEDPLKVVITGIRFITRQFEALTRFVQSPIFQTIVSILENVFTEIRKFAEETYSKLSPIIAEITPKIQDFFNRLSDQIKKDFDNPESILSKIRNIVQSTIGLFNSIFETIKAGDWDPGRIQQSVREIGKSIRDFITSIGEMLRETDIDTQQNFIVEIVSTLIEEIGRTISTIFTEVLSTLIVRAPSIVIGVIGIINKGVTGFFSQLFGNDGLGSVVGTILTAGLGVGLGVRLVRRLRSALEGIFDSISREARRVRSGPGGAGGFLNRLLGGGTRQRDLGVNIGTGGAPASALGFERELLMHVRRIATCVCNPLRRPGQTPPTRGGPARDPITGRTYPQYEPTRPAPGGGPSAPTPPSTQGTPRRGFRSRIAGFGRNLFRSRDLIDNVLPTSVDLIDQGVTSPTTPARGGGFRSRLGRGIRGFGKGALIAAGITAVGAGALGLLGGGSAQASEIDPETGQPIQTPEQVSKQNQMAGVGNVLGGGLEGAMLGATIGSIIPGVGTAVGAVIGGVIGGVVPLLDEGTRKGVSDFVSGLGKTLQDAGSRIFKGFQTAGSAISEAANRGVNWIKEGFASIGKFFSGIDWKSILINALVPGGQLTIQGLQNLTDFVSKLSVFDAIKAGIDSIRSAVDGIRQKLPPWLGGGGGNYAGLNFVGPALAEEARMSGAKPLVVNEKEFVIPSNGFSTLANLVEQRISPQVASNGGNISATFNVSLNVTGGGLTTDNVEQLRGPVLQIVEDAWKMATSGSVERGTTVI